ncbi:MAG: WecB/TagA/CpsF family glycosyltransferase [Bacteroidetes bacterium]|nr:WecB/TagA/CpsF family glycosyltransferase [Bacteroidota bacterium]MCH8233846.1 WecB/TagA/CpsF family glycosyltransferase [Bacteroidota bacterium]
MKNKRIFLFNTPVDCLTLDETVERINHAIREGRQVIHTCINANKVVLMEKDGELHKNVIEADIINADGQAVVWVSRLLKTPLPERVPGIDLMEQLLDLAHQKGYTTYFLGATQDVVEKVVEFYSKRHSEKIIAGFRNGYFTPEEQSQIAIEINNSGCSILFVAIPSPKKENFINQYRNLMSNVNLLMGVGGSFDVITGKVKRAPKWMQDNGLEWLFRLLQEPRKMWKRYLIGNIKYIRLAIRELTKK